MKLAISVYEAPGGEPTPIVAVVEDDTTEPECMRHVYVVAYPVQTDEG